MRKNADYLFLVAALIALGGALAMALGFANQWRVGGVAAWVNGESVSEERYASTLLAMQNSLRRSLTTEDRQRALRNIIDEELILQEALALGLARSDVVARKNLIQSLLTQATVASEVSDEQTLRAFFRQNKQLFAPPAQVSLQVLQAAGVDQAAMFAEALRQGQAFLEAGQAQGLTPIALPDDLPLERAAGYIGGSALPILKRMAANEIAGPLAFADGFIFIWLTARTDVQISYEQVASQVQAEWIRRQQEEAFADYLEELRQAAHIRTLISPGEPYL